MKSFINLLAIFVFMLAGSCGRSENQKAILLDTAAPKENIGSDGHYNISIIKLISSPEKYDGKRVRSIGYLHLEFEGNGLYLNKEDHDMGISKNAIWIDINLKHPEASALYKFSDHYVIIEGTFNGNSNGHMSAYSGSIKDITRIAIWPMLKDSKLYSDTSFK